MHRHAGLVGTVALCAAAAAATAGEAPDGAPEEAPTRERGRALLDARDYAGAEKVFAALVAKDGADGASWFLLGSARHARGDFRAALAALRRAAEFPRLRDRALYNAACALARLGETDAAIESLRAAAAAGFRDRGLLATDEDLAPLRKDPRFPAILRPLLRGAAAFVEPVRVLHEFEGEAAGDEFGWVARPVGDLDADGVADFAASSPGRAGAAGRVTVRSGRTGALLFAADGARGDRFGNFVAAAGDVDGDGTGDVAVGATQGGARAGYAVVLSGKTGREVLRVAGSRPDDAFGLEVCGAGDLDGDGRAEIAVSAWHADGPDGRSPDLGEVTVHSGATGAVLVRIAGERAGDLFGSAIDSAPRGAERLLAVGAMDAGPGRRGRVRVFRLTAKSAEEVFAIDSPATGADFGQYFVAFAGDVDGDGVSDLCVSDMSDAAKGPGTGRVVVASGKDGRTILDLAGESAGDGFGSSRSVCGDVDGDGRADLVVGAWRSAAGAPSGGRCSLVSGRDGRVLATYTSRMDEETLGFDATGLGDADGDGATDLLLSSGWSEVHGARTGRVWIVAGPKPGPAK